MTDRDDKWLRGGMLFAEPTSKSLMRRFLNEVVDAIAVDAPINRLRVDEVCFKLRGSTEGLPYWACMVLGLSHPTSYRAAAEAVSTSTFREVEVDQHELLMQQAASFVNKWRKGQSEVPAHGTSDAERVALFRWHRQLDEIRAWQRRMKKAGRASAGALPEALEAIAPTVRGRLGLPIEKQVREQLGIPYPECAVCTGADRNGVDEALTRALRAGDSRKQATKRTAHDFGYLESDVFWHAVRCTQIARDASQSDSR